MDLFALASLAAVAGAISFSSPCVLPLLPGYLAYLSGTSRPELSPGPDNRRTVLVGAAGFVLGFTVVFTALGASASALGLLLVRHQRVLIAAAGVLVVLFGVATTGLVRVPLLHRQLRLDLSRLGRPGGGPGRGVALGAAFAFGWTPCVGPVLASVLVTAAGSADLVRGVVLLMAYALGLGVPFMVMAVGVARGRGRWRWLAHQSRRIEVVGGVLLIVTGVAMLTGAWAQMMAGVLSIYARLGWPPL